MGTVAENVELLRKAATDAGLSEDELLAACQSIVASKEPTAQQMIQTVKAFASAQESPDEKMRRILGS